MENNLQILPRHNSALESSRLSKGLGTLYADSYAAAKTNPRIKLASILRRHKIALLLIFGICIAGGLLITNLLPYSYRSKIVLEVMGVNPDFMNNKALDPNTSIGSDSTDSYVETQTKLIMAEGVIDRTAKFVGPSVPSYLLERKGWMDKVRGWIGLSPAPPRSAESVVRSMLKHAKVKAEGQATLISATVDGPDPRLTAQVANALAEQYIDEVQDSRWNTAARTGEFLTRQLEGFRKKMEIAEDQLQNYARSIGMVYSDASRDSVAAERLREIQTDLTRAEADRTDRQSQLELVKTSAVEALPKIVDDGGLREYKSRLADLKRQAADLKASYTSGHYKVRHVEAQIAELQSDMEAERQTVIRRIQNDYDAAKRRQELLAAAYKAQMSIVSEQTGKQVRYNMLKHEVEANRDIYQSMLQRVKEANIISALRASNIRVADQAKEPTEPYSPKLVENLGIALLAAIMLSVLYVLLRERLDETLRMPGEAFKILDVPELGVIPSARVDTRTSAAIRRNSPLLIDMGGTDSGVGPRRGSTTALTKRRLGDSLVAESFRSAAASILMFETRRQVLLITSPHPQAGKTFTVSNLAIALSEVGRKVLIIDGDLRRPRLSCIFGCAEDEGLGTLLQAGGESLSFEQLIRPTIVPQLFILPSGRVTGNIPQLLHNTRLQAIIDAGRDLYDFILIDTPPMMAIADARLLSRHADGVILVCRAGQTAVDRLVAVGQQLAQDGTDVVGTILNDWNPHAEDPSYLHAYSAYARASRP
jgi:capsular exopolysaccharide synthesis family protein